MLKILLMVIGIMVGKWIGVLADPTRIEYVSHLTFDVIFFAVFIALFVKYVEPKIFNRHDD